jgi:hypothetical protein
MAENHEKGCQCCCPGPMGNPGPQGLPGLQGQQGAQGVPGQAGAQGIQGLIGPQGPAGNDGLPGAQGLPGPVGPMGGAGPAGPQGLQGIPGLDGKEGLMGPQGVPGPQGLQGVPGDCVECPCECEPEFEFAQIYSDQPQALVVSPGANLAGGPVLFNNIFTNTPAIDLTNVNLNGEIKFLKAGWYRVYEQVCATLNPLSAPLIVWGLALFKNGVLVPGTLFVDMTLSPDQQANNTGALSLVHFDVNDVLTLNNMTVQQLLLTAPGIGSGVNAQSASASMQIHLLKAD